LCHGKRTRCEVYGVRWPDTAPTNLGCPRPDAGASAKRTPRGRRPRRPVKPRPSKAASGRRTPYRLILRRGYGVRHLWTMPYVKSQPGYEKVEYDRKKVRAAALRLNE